jgi:endonuclease/exonuclease/phosphatase family metal-dependent hydrolase
VRACRSASWQISPWLAFIAAAMAGALAGCDLLRDDAGDAVDAAVDGPRGPRDDLVPALGGPATLDLAAWNIENFPKSTRSVADVGDLITSLDLDLVVVEEVASVEAWNELVAFLPEHEGVLSSHRYTPTSYQKIGLLYRASTVTVGTPELLFTGDTWAFPRPPFKVHVTSGGYDLDLIGVHLKAGGAPEDAERRALAAQELDAYLRAQLAGGGEDEVIVLGDYNEVVTTPDGRADLAPLLVTERYRLRTRPAADAGGYSFVPTPGRVIDHILTTAGLEDELGELPAIIPTLDRVVPRYDADITDHLPVVLLMPQR